MKVYLEHIITEEIKILDLPGVRHSYQWISDGGFIPYEKEFIIEYVEDDDELDNLRALSIIENEGFDYAVNSYCESYCFSDPKTRILWRKAKKSINNLTKYLKDEKERIDTEGDSTTTT
jgi:hypothetical protein